MESNNNSCDIIGNYVIIDKKSSSGMSSYVYKAKHKNTDQIVALKIFKESYIESSNYEFIANEIKTLKKLNGHPFINKFIDYGIQPYTN